MIKRLAPSNNNDKYKSDGKRRRFMFLTYTKGRNPSMDSPVEPFDLLGYDLNKQKNKYLCPPPFVYVS